MVAALEGRTREAGAIARVVIPAEWAEDAASTLRFRRAQLEADPSTQPWLLRLIVLRSTGELVGYATFHEPAGDRGWVEIGYSILADHRRRGYAEEAAMAMFAWAAAQGIERFRASVSPANAASLAMVRKMGFSQTGTQWDEVDGEEWVFETTARDLFGR